MKIVIAGCGKIGTAILKRLVKEDHDIVVMDHNPDIIANVMESYDVMGICTSSTDCASLRDANVGDAELFIATTDSDEHNMLSCLFAKRMGAKYTVARIRDKANNNENLKFIKDQLDISMVINPEILMAKSIHRMLRVPAAVKVESFARGRFEVTELNLKEDNILVGKKVSRLRSVENVPFLVCAVLRDKETIIPNGEFVLQTGDRIGIIAEPSDMQKLLAKFNLVNKSAKNIYIAGASRIAEYLSGELAQFGNDVTVIERNEDRCNEFRDLSPRSVSVICGDATNHDILLEEGIDKADGFISLLKRDEENILTSFFAASREVPVVITKVNSDGFEDTTQRLGLERIVSTKDVTADLIIQYARALRNTVGSKIDTLYSLMDSSAEALEFIVSKNFEKLNVPIKELALQDGVLVAGIIRNNKNIIPGGNDVILEGDRVIVISSGKKLLDLSEILK